VRTSFSSGLGCSFAYSFTRNEASRFVNGVKGLLIIHERLKNILTFNESYDIILEKYMNDEKRSITANFLQKETMKEC